MAIPIAAGAIRAASKILSVNKLFKRNVETAVEANAEGTKKSLKTIATTNKQVKLEEKKQKQLEKKIREDIRNEAAESKLEKRRGLPTMKGLINNVVKKPMNALLNLLAAWAVSNLPWIIKQLKIIVKKVKVFKKAFGTAMTGIGNSVRGLYRIVIAALQNMKEFDFSDKKGRIKDAVDEFNEDREEMITGFTEMKDVWGRDEAELDTILKSMSEGETLEKALRMVDAEFVNNTTALTPVTGSGAGGKGNNTQLPQGIPQTTGGNSDFWTLVAVASREDSDGQGRADVAQSIYNRAMVGSSGGFLDGISGNILGRMQYEPTWQYPNGPKNGKGNPNDEWKNITDAASAAKASGLSVGEMQTVANQLRDPQNQQRAAGFVQGATDFRGYPTKGGKLRKAGDNYFGHYNNYTTNKTAPIPSMGSPSTSTQTQAQPQQSSQQAASNIASGIQPPTTGALASDTKGMTLGNNTLRSSDFDTMDRSVPSTIIRTSNRGMRNGRHHGGIDFAPPGGDKRWFCGFLANGKVTFVGTLSGYGMTVIIEAMGKDFLFAHLSEYSPGIRVGAPYKSGQPIGRVGSTGTSTSEHLHFEVRTVGGGYGSDIPAKKYVKYLVFGMMKKRSSTLTASGKGGANADELARVASSRRTGAGSNQGGSTTVLTINQPFLVG